MTTAELAGPMPRHYAAPAKKAAKPADDGVSARVKEFRDEVAEAAQLRAHETHPDVVAYRLGRTQRVVERFVYAAILCGLAFTVVNVQQFAAGDATTQDLSWYSAWVLDPVVTLGLIGILIAGRALARADVHLGSWCRRAQWVLLALTYAMNTWQSWAKGTPSLILLHSVPPLVVFVLVESLSELRERFAIAIDRAHQAATVDEPAPVEQAKPAAPAELPTQPVAPAAPAPAPKPDTDGRPAGKPTADDPAWIAYAAKVVARLDAQHSREVGRSIVQPALAPIGTPAAAALLAAVRQAGDTAPRLTAVR